MTARLSRYRTRDEYFSRRMGEGGKGETPPGKSESECKIQPSPAKGHGREFRNVPVSLPRLFRYSRSVGELAPRSLGNIGDYYEEID